MGRTRHHRCIVDDARVGRIRWLIVPLGLILAWLEVRATSNADPIVLVFDLAAGMGLLAGAVIVLDRGQRRRVGFLSASAGATWYLGALAPALAGLYLGPLSHLIVAYPTGRARPWLATTVAMGAYAVALAQPLVAIDLRGTVLAAAATVACVGALRARGALRRGRWSSAIVGTAIALAAGLGSVAAGQGWIAPELGQTCYAGVIASGAIWLAVDLRWGGWSEDALTRLVVDLGDRTEPWSLRGRLADALDDPTVVIGYRVAEGTGYIDEAGQSVAVPPVGSGRVAVPLIVGGTEVGVLVRDARLDTDPVLANGVAQAAELAVANVRLNAATRQQLEDLERSRARLIAAGESERSRIRRELGSGALRRLAAVEDRLAWEVDDGDGRRLLDEVRAVIAQLDEFALGLGAESLLNDGLAEALRRIGENSSVPVVLDVPPGRWSTLVESTAYFVAAEALANVGRHAGASRVSVRVEEIRDVLLLEIEDDGVGGAIPSPGSGLEGLIQRVEATGGWLRIADRQGGGTRLTAELPIDRAASPQWPARPSRL